MRRRSIKVPPCPPDGEAAAACFERPVGLQHRDAPGVEPHQAELRGAEEAGHDLGLGRATEHASQRAEMIDIGMADPDPGEVVE